jgi:hypothetical protein
MTVFGVTRTRQKIHLSLWRVFEFQHSEFEVRLDAVGQLFSPLALSNPSYNKPLFAMLVYMTKKDKVPDALREGSNKSNVLIAVDKQIRNQRAFHTRVTTCLAQWRVE